ncbi:MAG: secretin N-terminal domain-containing protein, partial [Planctomycetota bacterium]
MPNWNPAAGGAKFYANYDYNSNSVFVTTTAECHEKVAALIAEMDVVDEKEAIVVKTYKIKNAQASSVYSAIYYGFRNDPAAGGSKFYSTYDSSSNSVILATTPEYHEKAEQLISEMDAEDPKSAVAVKTYKLEHAKASSVYSAVYSAFRSDPAAGGSKFSVNYDTTTNTVVVSTTPQYHEKITQLIAEMDVGEEPITQAYKLKYFQASSAYSAIYNGFRDQVQSSGGTLSVNYESGSNTVIVTAPQEFQEKAAQLIAELDKPGPADEAEFKAIILQNADPEYVAGKLEELFEQDRYSYRSSGAQKTPFRVVAEAVSNRVLVSASPEDFAKAETLAQQIDQDYTAKEFIRKTFMLEYIESREMASVIEALFAESGGGRSSYSYYRRSSSSASPAGVKVEEFQGGIVVFAPKDKMDQIEQVIAQLDTDPAKDNEVRTYTVENVDYNGTSSLARNLQEMFGGDRYRRRSSQSTVKFFGESGSNMLIVSAPSTRMEEIDKMVKEMLKSKEGEDLTMVIRHIDINQARPSDVADMVQPILETKYQELQQKSGSGRSRYGYGYGSGPQVTAHTNARKVMVSAPESMMDLAEQLIREFDQESMASTTSIVALKNGKAEEIAPVVEQMMAESSGGSSYSGYRSSRSRYSSYSRYRGYGSSGSTQADELKVIPVEANNSIMLKGPQEKVYEAEQLIVNLDKDAVPEGPMFKVFDIEHAEIFDVVNMIEEMVGGGGSDYYSYSSAGGESVIVKADYLTSKLIISAPREKFPMIEQIIELKESLALAEQQRPPEKVAGSGEIIDRDRYGNITMSYDVVGSCDQIAKGLDKICVDFFGWFDAPYIRSFPFAQQIIIEGKPEQFKLVEEWLKKIEKDPPKPKITMVMRQVSDVPVPPSKIVQALKAAAPTGFKISESAMPRKSRGRDPLDILGDREINYDDPIDKKKSSKKTSNGARFVPTNTLGELYQALSAVLWTQVESVTPAEDVKNEPAADAVPPHETNADEQDGRSPEELAEEAIQGAAFQAMTTGEVQIKYDDESGMIYMIGPAPQVEEVKEAMNEILRQYEEITPEVKQRIRVFPVRYIDVNVAAAILEQMFNERTPRRAKSTKPEKKEAKKPEPKEKEEEGEEGKSARQRRKQEEKARKEEEAAGREGAQGGQRIKVVPDPRTNTLIIKASQEDFPAVAELLLKIDRPGGGSPVDIEVIPLKRLNALEVEQVLKAILRIEEKPPKLAATLAGMSAIQQATMIETLQRQVLQMSKVSPAAQTADGEVMEGDEDTLKINPSKDITITADAATNSIIVSAPED